MAVNLTIVLAAGQTGFNPDGSGLVKENVKITGASSSANDTGTYTTIMKQPQYADLACCSYSISGQVVTANDEVGLGSTTVAGVVYGFP